jgi:CSLREA domain-containing protein
VRILKKTGLLAFAVTLVFTAPAAAATFNVTTTADTALGSCDASCTLREAVVAANTDPGSTIVVPAGTYTLALGFLTDDDDGLMGDLDILASVTIQGAGAGETIIDAGPYRRLVHVPYIGLLCDHDPQIAISGVTLTGADRIEEGAGIFLLCGDLTLSDSAIVDNKARSGGGGLSVGSGTTATVVRTKIAGNSEEGIGSVDFSGGGGGIRVEIQGFLDLRDSEVSGNTSGAEGEGIGEGGGILNRGEATLTNVTVSGNTAAGDQDPGFGGGIFSYEEASTTTLLNVTIVDNRAGPGTNGPSLGCGGNIGTSEFCNTGGSDGNVILRNTIIAAGEGRPGEENCSGLGIVSEGHNLEDSNTCGLASAGDITNIDPILGALAENGGPTRTHALTEPSPPIDRADAPACPDADQRAVDRPQRQGCDIGAFELPEQAAPAVTNPPPPQVLTPAPILPPAPPAVAAAAPSLSLRLAGTPRSGCRATDFRLRVRPLPRGAIRSVTVSLDGRRIARRRSSAPFGVRVAVARLKAGRHRVRVVLRGTQGQRMARAITFRRCRRAAPAQRRPRFTG